jgi:hypothetical protein
MKKAVIGVPISLCLLLSACWNGGTGTETKTTTDQNCACDQFPFPAACSSKCEVGEATIESVNVTVAVRNGTQTELRTIPLSKLPAGQAAEKGAIFRTLLKKDMASPGNASKIVRLTEPTKAK